MKEKLSKTSIVCIIALFCCSLWGSAFPCIKIGYSVFRIESSETASQILFAGIRFTLAGLLSVCIGSIVGKKLLLPSGKNIHKIALLSIFQTILQYLFFYIGLAHTTGVKSSIIKGANVFIVILVSSLVFRQEKLSARNLVACVIGFAGVVIINLGGGGLSFEMSFAGEGVIFLSMLANSMSSVLMKKFSKDENPVLLSGYQFMLGGIVMILCGAFMGGRLEYTGLSSFGILIYLAFLSAAAYSLWSLLLKYNPVSRVAVYSFATPVMGVVFSMLLLDESSQSFGLRGFAALLLICAGIYIVNSKKKEAAD